MRTVSFKSVLEGAARRSGLDPVRGDFTDEVAATVVEYINDAVELGWNHYWWPEWTYCQQRYFRADWSSTQAYVVGDEVYLSSEDKYYVAILPSTNQNPATATTYWEEATDMSRYVALAQSWQPTEIGMVAGCWKNDLRTSATNEPVPYGLGEEGVTFKPDAPTSVWIQFKPPPPKFTAVAYSATASYAAGALTYYTDGECYKNTSGSTVSGEAPTTGSSWTKVEFPAALDSAVKRFVTAEMLRDDSQHSKAEVVEDRAWSRLIDSFMQQAPLQGITRRYTVGGLSQ